MKKSILILMLLQSFTVAAQIRISDFKQSHTDGAASDVRTSLSDPDGKLCAVLKLETKQSGWTFDTGLDGIIDTRYEDGLIWLYVPASARKLTVAHKEYGTLREWSFPVSLESGRTYTMRLSYDRPRPATSSRNTTTTPTPAPNPRPASAYQSTSSRTVQPKPAPKNTSSDSDWIGLYPPNRSGKEFCNHFADFYMGFGCSKDYGDYYETTGDVWCSLSYTWIGNRIGPYMSLGTNFDECGSVFGGVAYRITNPDTANLDWQVYGGLGLMDGMFGLDIGTRFAWRSSYTLSHWDFGFGCQFTQGTIMPTVNVGLYIWGIPTLICLGLVACAMGG